MNESARRRLVSPIAHHSAQQEADVLIESMELLAKRAPRTEEITANVTVHRQDKGRFRFPVGVVGGQIVGKQLPVFEQRIDRLPKKPGRTAQLAHPCAVLRLK